MPVATPLSSVTKEMCPDIAKYPLRDILSPHFKTTAVMGSWETNAGRTVLVESRFKDLNE